MTTTRVPLPPSLSGHIADRPSEPVGPRDAATVVLLRDGAAGTEAYLLRRQRSMKFAAGAYVFPGGGVDRRDCDASIGWVGPPAPAWAERFGCDEETARALVCAAVRETFEEAGVLLAGPDAESVVADTSGPEWLADRLALESHELSLAEFLVRRSLVLRADLLGAWAHWITPDFEPRRFDTRFFVAVMPDGQQVGELPGEADRADWIRLDDALASVEQGAMTMLPPTQVTCGELARLGSSADALPASREREIITVLPRLVADGDDYFLETDLP